MGRDNQPKHRQAARDLRRRAATRGPIDRLLIVCEGEKTEPQYLDEIRVEYRLQTANVQILPSDFGTDPLSVVNYAERLFLKGDSHRGIAPHGFDRVTTVFDRDDHATFEAAIAKVRGLDGAYRNDEKRAVPFDAAVSVPCFELWLLLHFRDVQQTMQRGEVIQQLATYLDGYSKGQKQLWQRTKPNLEAAVHRAKAIRPNGVAGPYTDVDALVERLRTLKGGF
jgi:hypothetical protein